MTSISTNKKTCKTDDKKYEDINLLSVSNSQ